MLANFSRKGMSQRHKTWKKRPRHTQFISITADKFNSAQTYEYLSYVRCTTHVIADIWRHVATCLQMSCRFDPLATQHFLVSATWPKTCRRHVAARHTMSANEGLGRHDRIRHSLLSHTPHSPTDSIYYYMQSMSCADCGVEGGASLKICKSCMLVKYCNPTCQRNHWPKHKKQCKQRAAELRDEPLFKVQGPTAERGLSHLLLTKLTNAGEIDKLCLASSRNSILRTTYQFTTLSKQMRNEGFAQMETEEYFTCWGKCICKGCVHSLRKSGNHGKCPYCNSDRVFTVQKY